MKINFASIKDVLVKNASKIAAKGKKALPSVLIGVGCIGIGVAAWKTCEKTPESKKVVDNFQAERENLDNLGLSEEEKRKRVLGLYKKAGFDLVKIYYKPVGLGLLSVTMVFLGHGKMKKEITTLAATATSLDKMFRDYRGRVVDKYGEDEDFNLRHGIHEVEVEETVTNEKGKEKKVKKKVDVIDDELSKYSIYSRIFDESVAPSKDPTYIRYFLNTAQDWANAQLVNRGYLTLNDVLECLGYKRCKEGCVVGWIYNPEFPNGHIDFGMKDINKTSVANFLNGFESCIMLDFNVDGVIYDKLPSFSAPLV